MELEGIMEIERKYKINKMPEHLDTYEKKVIEQGYLCTNPIIRIRRSNDKYILTYKSKFGLEGNKNQETCVSNEVEVMLNESGYEHLKTKVDNQIIMKTRYLIPLDNGLTAELDVFGKQLEGLELVEVEFPSEEAANEFTPPEWFGENVSMDHRYKNNYLATLDSYSKKEFQ